MAIFASKEYPLKSKNPVVIRSAAANDQDVQAIEQILHSVISENDYTLLNSGEFRPAPGEGISRIQKAIDHPAHLWLVAVIDSKIVGYLDFSCGHRTRIAHTGSFAVVVDCQFRDRGVGESLLDALIDWATLHQTLEKISLKVHANNQRAIGLYHKLGFEIDGVAKRDLKYSTERYVDTVSMSFFVKPVVGRLNLTEAPSDLVSALVPTRWKSTFKTHVAKTFLFDLFKVGFVHPKKNTEKPFDVIETSNWVNIIPVTKDGFVVMVRQFRFGTQEITLEFPAGTIEPGERPLVAAKRELVEETGYEPGEEQSVLPIGQCRPNPAFLSNFCFHFAVHDVELKTSQALDENEDIAYTLIRLGDIDHLIETGQITHSLAITAWHFYKSRFEIRARLPNNSLHSAVGAIECSKAKNVGRR